MPTWPSAMPSSGFTYASDSEPAAPEEGETWYDLNSNEAKVYDGVGWQKLTVTEHAELGNVSAGQHRSDSNIIGTVDGQVDADTIDGQHASDLGGSTVEPFYFREERNSPDGQAETLTIDRTFAGKTIALSLKHNVGGQYGSEYNGYVDWHLEDGTVINSGELYDSGQTAAVHRVDAELTTTDVGTASMHAELMGFQIT